MLTIVAFGGHSHLRIHGGKPVQDRADDPDAPVSCSIRVYDGANYQDTTVNVNTGPSMQTITSNPPGRTVLIDGQSYYTPVQFFWTVNSTRTLSIISSPQSGASGTQYRFANWTDSGVPYTGASHSLTAPSTNATYVANFVTQYYLTTSASPTNEGNIAPPSNWYDSGTVSVSATPVVGFQLSSFSGALSGITNPQVLALNAPASVTANFAAASVAISDSTIVPGAQGVAQGFNGLAATVTITGLSGLPSGTLPISPITIPASTPFNVNIQIPDNAPTGDYTVTASVSGGGNPQPQFRIHVPPFLVGGVPATALPLTQWEAAAEFGLTVGARRGTKIVVSASAPPSAPPQGIAVFPDPQVLTTGGTFNIRIVASDSSPLGNQAVSLTISCDSSTPCGGYTRTVSIPVSIAQAPGAEYFTLQTNLDTTIADSYLSQMGGNAPAIPNSCDATWTWQRCYRSSFKNSSNLNADYKSNNYIGQGVTGVRLLIPLNFPGSHAWDVNNRGALVGVPGGPMCDGTTCPSGTYLVDSFWSNFTLLLQDLRSYGIRYITPLLGWENFAPPTGPYDDDEHETGMSTGAAVSTCYEFQGQNLPPYPNKTVYFYDFLPYGWVRAYNWIPPDSVKGTAGYWEDLHDYTIECAGRADGYLAGQHPPNFWGWQTGTDPTTGKDLLDGPYYKVLDKFFKTIHDAQLQVNEFEPFEEGQFDNHPVRARMIQDNDANNNLVHDVYKGTCAIMARYGFTAPNGACLVTFDSQSSSPHLDNSNNFTDCTSYMGEPAMTIQNSYMMHAFAGDYFGGLDTIAHAAGLVIPPPPQGTGIFNLNCSTRTLTEGDINNFSDAGVGGQSHLPQLSTLPAIIDVHSSVCNVGIDANNGAHCDSDIYTVNARADSNVTRAYYDDLRSLVVNPHYTIRQPSTQFSVPRGALYPAMVGETFTNQPTCRPWEIRLDYGALEDAAGYRGSSLFSLKDAGGNPLWDGNGNQSFAIFRPWHFVRPGCDNPTAISPPYYPHSTWPSQ